MKPLLQIYLRTAGVALARQHSLTQTNTIVFVLFLLWLFTSSCFTNPPFTNPCFRNPRLTSPRFTSPVQSSPVQSSPPIQQTHNVTLYRTQFISEAQGFSMLFCRWFVVRHDSRLRHVYIPTSLPAICFRHRHDTLYLITVVTLINIRTLKLQYYYIKDMPQKVQQ